MLPNADGLQVEDQLFESHLLMFEDDFTDE